jgi:hypothetical protein
MDPLIWLILLAATIYTLVELKIVNLRVITVGGLIKWIGIILGALGYVLLLIIAAAFKAEFGGGDKKS